MKRVFSFIYKKTGAPFLENKILMKTKNDRKTKHSPLPPTPRVIHEEIGRLEISVFFLAVVLIITSFFYTLLQYCQMKNLFSSLSIK